MLFNSYIFILLFLPVTLCGYFLCGRRGRYEWGKTWLIAMSLWFYAYFNIRYLPIIVGSILINFSLYRRLLGSRGKEGGRRGDLYLTAAGVAANLGVLFYYKYFDFFLENVNAVFHLDFTLQRVILPLGISFFTFQQVGFLIDSYRGETGNYSFLDYALFVTFFPQLIAGPIVTHGEMIPQFRDIGKKRWDFTNTARGIYAFACGLGKKVLVADIFGKAVAWGYGNLDSLNGLAAVWLVASYTVQLYFDFSGYCDMARGLGFLFNIEIPLNFNSPYKAVNLVDFWKRWHITLNRFFTKYVYIPLGGSRKGRLRASFNVFLIYLVSGIWHGAGWNYMIWGSLHGFVYVLTRRFLKIIERIPKALAWAGQMLFFMASLVFFRSQTLGQAFLIFRKAALGGYRLDGIPAGFAEQFRTGEFFYLLKVMRVDVAAYGDRILMFAYMAAAWLMLLCAKNVNERLEEFRPTLLGSLFVVLLLLWSILSFSEVSTFLYFNF